jgi:membrane protease YdiL (CAAX protease family)
MWIIAYVVLLSVSDSFSALLGIEKAITAPVSIVFVLLIFGFIKKHDLSEQYGLCSFKGNPKTYLYFIPLLLIISVNLWNGVAMNVSALETVLFILSMICVGFIEEVIFRGFLFKAMCKGNVKLAIFVSSITFGIGHIVNLLNGRDFIPTLLQICYATAIGLLFTIVFYKGKSLWPCIITHSLINSSSVFAVENSSLMYKAITAAVLCVISAGYAMWILKKAKKSDECGNTNRR